VSLLRGATKLVICSHEPSLSMENISVVIVYLLLYRFRSNMLDDTVVSSICHLMTSPLCPYARFPTATVVLASSLPLFSFASVRSAIQRTNDCLLFAAASQVCTKPFGQRSSHSRSKHVLGHTKGCRVPSAGVPYTSPKHSRPTIKSYHCYDPKMWKQPRRHRGPESSTSRKPSSTAQNPVSTADFTFGLEFEFIFVSLKRSPDKDEYDAWGPNAFAVGIVRETLMQPLQARCRICAKLVCVKIPLHDSPVARREWENDYDVWEVDSEPMFPRDHEMNAAGGGLLGFGGPYLWHGVEIKSRSEYAVEQKPPLKHHLRHPLTGSPHEQKYFILSDACMLRPPMEGTSTKSRSRKRLEQYLLPCNVASVSLKTGSASIIISTRVTKQASTYM